MTSITVEVPDEVAEAARTQGLLEPQRLTPLVCEVLVRETGIKAEADREIPADRPFFEDLMQFAGSAGPGLPEDFAANHNHYIHGTPK